MKLKEILKREQNNLASFYLVLGEREENKKDILEFLEKNLKFDILKNPDFFIFTGEKFLIEKAREIKKIDSKKKAFGGQRIFLLSFETVGADTQNTLLKILEEPSENTIFFFLFATSKNILATIKSRARIIENYSENINIIAEEYFSASFLEREKIYLNLEKEEMSTFFNSLDLLLLKNKKKVKNFSNFYKNFLELKKNIGNKGISTKHIFNYLNIYTPIL